ncbi:MAG: glycosyltransferase [Chloroflexota bacterium]|nr:glycosyltransferase [Chloroflexota bacterium]
MNGMQKCQLYPLDRSTLVNMLDMTSAESRNATVRHPSSITLHALIHWNAYLTGGEREESAAFLRRANWLLAHESRLPNRAGSWPVPLARPIYYATGPFLSASVQGMVLSVLTRAYQLTGEATFLHAARRALSPFQLDILDSGIHTPAGDTGRFFEEVAVYPAAHILHGHLLGLLGLYDYALCAHNQEVEKLLAQGLNALDAWLDAFDTGSWTRCDLLYRSRASTPQHALHIQLLEALADSSRDARFGEWAARWKGYQREPEVRWYCQMWSHFRSYSDRTIRPLLRRSPVHSGPLDSSSLLRICVPVTAFPVPGGIRGVLAGVTKTMQQRWQMTYVTRAKGPDAAGLDIRQFWSRGTHPWHFPAVWLYVVTGGRKLLSLLWHRPGYDLLLPQDGIATGAFAALVGKLAGARVVCMDHGSITLLGSSAFRIERAAAMRKSPWQERIRSVIHWPSMHFLARIATRYCDLFLVAGDEVEDVYRQGFSVHTSRIMRYVYMVDAERFLPPARTTQAKTRGEQGIPADAIVITLINRLAPEKGLDVAIEGIAHALAALNPEIRARVRIVIAGDGPLRSQISADIQRYDLAASCLLWGAATPQDVVLLLGMTDIFLYSGTRGTNYSVAVLEAMAAGCVVVASVVPRSNARLLADGRGIAIPPGSATAMSDALARLCHDPLLRRHMGEAARNYVATQHNASTLERSLLRASFFQPLLQVNSRRGDDRLREEDDLKETE